MPDTRFLHRKGLAIPLDREKRNELRERDSWTALHGSIKSGKKMKMKERERGGERVKKERERRKEEGRGATKESAASSREGLQK